MFRKDYFSDKWFVCFVSLKLLKNSKQSLIEYRLGRNKMMNRVVVIFVNMRERCRRVTTSFCLLGCLFYEQQCPHWHCWFMYRLLFLQVLNGGKERMFLDMWVTEFSSVLWSFASSFMRQCKRGVMQHGHLLSHEKRRYLPPEVYNNEGRILESKPLTRVPLKERSQDLQWCVWKVGLICLWVSN